jgi:uncharacterized protein YutE (UPF0331/DUF86 family)
LVKADVVAQKVATARQRLRGAGEIFARTLDELLADEPARDLACFYLFLAIQECIDLATHWVADADWGTPDDVGGAFDILRDKGLISGQLAQGMRGATGLRNRIAHGYGSLDPERIRSEYRAGSALLLDFLSTLAEAAGLE